MSRESEYLNAVTLRRFLGVMMVLASMMTAAFIMKIWWPRGDVETVAESTCGLEKLPVVFMVDPRQLADGKLVVMQMRSAPTQGTPGQGTAWLLGVGDKVVATDACGQDVVQIYLGTSNFRTDSLPPPIRITGE